MVLIDSIKKLIHGFMQKVWEDRFPIIFIICLAMVMIFMYISNRVNIKNTYETCTIQSVKTVDRGGTVAGYNDDAPVGVLETKECGTLQMVVAPQGYTVPSYLETIKIGKKYKAYKSSSTSDKDTDFNVLRLEEIDE